MFLLSLMIFTLACNPANPVFVAGETFGFSSLQEPSWSSSFSENDRFLNDIPDEKQVKTSKAPTYTTPNAFIQTEKVTTTPIRSMYVTTSMGVRPLDYPYHPPNPRSGIPKVPVPDIEHETDRKEHHSNEDRTQLTNIILAFKSIVRSIKDDMGNLRESCELCSSGMMTSNSDEPCPSSTKSTADMSKVKQQLRDVKETVKGMSGVLTQISDRVASMSVHMSGVQPKDCMEILLRGQRSSGVFYIQPEQQDRPFLTFCDMETNGGGWTMIQKHENDQVDFNRGWGSYRRGFGEPNYSHWIGLDKIYALLSQDEYEFRIELEEYNGRRSVAHYSYMTIDDKNNNYALHLGNYNGTAGDSLGFHDGAPFTTRDKDNDKAIQYNCAVNYNSGWWFTNCLYANLNGLHPGQEETNSFAHGLIWSDITGYNHSLRSTKMMVRPTN